MLDNVSVVIRSTLLTLRTPEHLLGRVSAVNQIFIGSSNEIGSFESGVAARLLGTVNSVIFGGLMTLGVVGVTAWKIPALRELDELELRIWLDHPPTLITPDGEAMTTEIASTPRKPWYRLSLTTWIMIGLVVGGFIGWIRPEWGNKVYFLRDIFLNLIKSVIAPLVFSTLVVGIAGGGDLKKVGRMGAKALLYFEIVTTVALFIGLAVVNLTKPGVGVTLAAPVTEHGAADRREPPARR